MGRRMYVTPIATRETAASEAVRSVHTRGVVHSVARNTTTTRIFTDPENIKSYNDEKLLLELADYFEAYYEANMDLVKKNT